MPATDYLSYDLKKCLALAARRFKEVGAVAHECQVAIVHVDLQQRLASYQALFLDHEPTSYHYYTGPDPSEEPWVQYFRHRINELQNEGLLPIPNAASDLLRENDVFKLIELADRELREVRFVNPVLYNLFVKAAKTREDVQVKSLSGLETSDSERDKREEELGVTRHWAYGCILEEFCLARHNHPLYCSLFFNAGNESEVFALVAAAKYNVQSTVSAIRAAKRELQVLDEFKGAWPLQEAYQIHARPLNGKEVSWAEQVSARVVIPLLDEVDAKSSALKIKKFIERTEARSPDAKQRILKILAANKDQLVMPRHVDDLLKRAEAER